MLPPDAVRLVPVSPIAPPAVASLSAANKILPVPLLTEAPVLPKISPLVTNEIGPLLVVMALLAAKVMALLPIS